MKKLKLNQWLHLLENRYPGEINLNLDRVSLVANKLQIKFNAKVITVAGTNGKGSTVCLLESLYHQAGYKVASYTSPHLLRFNERIKINQSPISDQDLSQAFAVVEQARADIPLTYFEMATLAAFWHFNQQNLEVIILEVGLGGRLDAVNIVNSDLAIITTIDYDHQAFLGSTFEAIGYEKAGILRSKQPFIYASKNCPNSIIQRGLELNSPGFFYDSDYRVNEYSSYIAFIFKNYELKLPKINFPHETIGASLMACNLLEAWLPINTKNKVIGLKKAFILGRCQLIKTAKVHLLDVAHNRQSAQYLADYLKNNYLDYTIHAIFSCLKDKEIQALIFPLKTKVTCWHLSLLPGLRAAPKEQLIQAFEKQCISSIIWYDNPSLAYQGAYRKASNKDLILIYGSFVMVGEILALLNNKDGV